MDGVEVLGDIRIVLIREGGCECGSGEIDHGVSIVGKVGDGILGSSMTLNVCDDRVSMAILLLKVYVSNLDESFDLVTNVYIPRNGGRVIGNFVLECDLGLQTEDEGGTHDQGLELVVYLKPLLRQQNINGSIGWIVHHIVRLLNDLKGVFVIHRATAV